MPCLFVRKPDVSWPLLIAISFSLFLGQFLAQAFAIAHGVPVGLSSVIVQSQALFTIGVCRADLPRAADADAERGIAIATVGLLMICGTVGYDFSVGAFAIIMICPISFAIGNLLLRRAHGAPMFDLFAWLCLTAAVPLAVIALVSNGPAPTWHRTDPRVADRHRLHARARRHLDQHRLLAVGPAAARLSGGAGGAVRAAGAVRRRPAASSIVFGETFGPLRLAGMITVIGGIAVMLLARRPRVLPEAAGA